MIRAPVSTNACFWSASGEFGCGGHAKPAGAASAKEGFCGGAVRYEGFQEQEEEQAQAQAQAQQPMQAAAGTAASDVLERMAQAIGAPPPPPPAGAAP